jgi:hypothetical protein
MTCHRCQGFMCPVDFLVGRSESECDSVRGWRCVACGEIVDWMIVWNRVCVRDQRLVKRLKDPRQPVRLLPAM